MACYIDDPSGVNQTVTIDTTLVLVALLCTAKAFQTNCAVELSIFSVQKCECQNIIFHLICYPFAKAFAIGVIRHEP